MMNPKSATELIGTAILVFTIQTSVSLGSSMAPLAIGAILIATVFAGGPISGAHYNPAVTLGLSIANGFSNLGYGAMVTVANFLGGAMAAACFRIIAPGEFDSLSAGEAVVGETMPFNMS